MTAKESQLFPKLNDEVCNCYYFALCGKTFGFSAFGGSGISPAAVGEAASLIKKETIEHRTSNIERPTSNKVFCQFKKRLNKANLPLEIVRINIPLSLYHVFSVIRLF